MGSLMAVSQPAAQLGVTGHQAKAAKAEDEIGDIEHALRSATND